LKAATAVSIAWTFDDVADAAANIPTLPKPSTTKPKHIINDLFIEMMHFFNKNIIEGSFLKHINANNNLNDNRYY
jgi:hypothetical protein